MIGITNRALAVIKDVFFVDSKLDLDADQEIRFRFSCDSKGEDRCLSLGTEYRRDLAGFNYVVIEGLKIYFYFSDAEIKETESCVIDTSNGVISVEKVCLFESLFQ